jgi:hypothetical protein
VDWLGWLWTKLQNESGLLVLRLCIWRSAAALERCSVYRAAKLLRLTRATTADNTCIQMVAVLEGHLETLPEL